MSDLEDSVMRFDNPLVAATSVPIAS